MGEIKRGKDKGFGSWVFTWASPKMLVVTWVGVLEFVPLVTY